MREHELGAVEVVHDREVAAQQGGAVFADGLGGFAPAQEAVAPLVEGVPARGVGGDGLGEEFVGGLEGAGPDQGHRLERLAVGGGERAVALALLDEGVGGVAASCLGRRDAGEVAVEGGPEALLFEEIGELLAGVVVAAGFERGEGVVEGALLLGGQDREVHCSTVGSSRAAGVRSGPERPRPQPAANVEAASASAASVRQWSCHQLCRRAYVTGVIWKLFFNKSAIVQPT